MKPIWALREAIKKQPLLSRAAALTKQSIRSSWYRLAGVGYVKRRIASGPNEGLVFFSGRRVKYSRDFWSGRYEIEACQFMQRVIRHDSVCYDIGANLGFHTLVMARRASEGIVFAFEPLPEAGRIFERNMLMNGIDNAVLIRKAVTRATGSVALGRNITIDQAAAAWTGMRDPIHQVFTCESVNVDDFVGAGNSPPGFIKIDVEGAETEVLMGAINTLSHFQPLVICETHGTGAARDVYQILVENGYRLFAVGRSLTPIMSVTGMPANMHEGLVFAQPGQDSAP